ncbi:hypothetical protein BAZO_19558 [Schinkia azotoformans LMG 9581]|uniref:Uncharacterized protein n=1 Tax=Schinkia azotoformans LMG 9581 TaxID=1131731 RepID=K6BVQ2_SCHAZ|nr:hypothetical protein BAZO_19558 [Schinkia azotoformans LMG 9581]
MAGEINLFLLKKEVFWWKNRMYNGKSIKEIIRKAEAPCSSPYKLEALELDIYHGPFCERSTFQNGLRK